MTPFSMRAAALDEGASFRPYLGRLTSVHIADGCARTIAFQLDVPGQILVRCGTSNAATNPQQVYYYFNGVQIGANSNDGNAAPEFAAAILERLLTPPTTPGAFRRLLSVKRSYDGGIAESGRKRTLEHRADFVNRGIPKME